MTDLAEPRPIATDDVTLVDLKPQQAAIAWISGPVGDLARLMGGAFEATSRAITSAGAAFAGPPFARYTGFGEVIEAELGFPFTGEVLATDDVRVVALPGGRAATTRHIGPYDEIAKAWERGTIWMKERGLVPSGPAWECYLTGPEEPGPPVTEIFWPLD